MRAVATEADQIRELSAALLAAGAEEEAVLLFRRVQKANGGIWPPDRYAQYLAFHGRADELEAVIRQTIEAVPADQPEERSRTERRLQTRRVFALLAQGRFSEWWQFGLSFPPMQKNPVLLEVNRLLKGRLTGDASTIRDSISELDRLGALDDVDVASEVALQLAVAGDTALAAPLVVRTISNPRYRDVLPHSRMLLEASVDWERGATAEAERKMAIVQESPSQNGRFQSLVMGSELARSRGNCGRTVTALEQVRALRFSVSVNPRIYGLPFHLHSLALCYEKLGDLPKARERNAEMLRLWAKADPDLPMLAEAKALQARLTPAGSSSR